MQEENYYNELKNEVLTLEAKLRTRQLCDNIDDLKSRLNIGKIIVQAQGGEEKAKYGDQLIKRFAQKLTSELGKGYTPTLLKRMRQFYLLVQKGATLWHQLTWSHIRTLLPIKDIDKINYYIKQVKIKNLSVRQLEKIIKQKEYERLPKITKSKLIKKEKVNKLDLIKDSIFIDNQGKEVLNEKELQQIILRNIEDFLSQLGEGYTFIKSEYKVVIDNVNNYIDLLLFNYIYNCFVVVELKTTQITKQHLGQVLSYMDKVDETLKTNRQNKTYGIIIGKEHNKYIAKFCYKNNIKTTKYITI